MTRKIRVPNHPWRIIRGGIANYDVRTYATKAERDTDAQHWADVDSDNVLTEQWSAEHSQDDLNQGWGCDGVVYPAGMEPEPEPEPGPRCVPLELPVGKTVDVWGYGSLGDVQLGDSGVHKGTLVSVERHRLFGAPWLDVLVTFEDNRHVHCVEYAVAHIIEEDAT